MAKIDISVESNGVSTHFEIHGVQDFAEAHPNSPVPFAVMAFHRLIHTLMGDPYREAVDGVVTKEPTEADLEREAHGEVMANILPPAIRRRMMNG